MSQPPIPPEPDDELASEFDAAISFPGVDPLSALANLLQCHGTRVRVRVLEATSLQGTEIAGYRLECLIGTGGMGATYRAVDAAGDQVAVKVVGALSEEHRARFEVEWKNLKLMMHPGVVRYLDHGITADGNGYLVMEFIEGQSLQDVLEGLVDPAPDDPIVTKLLVGTGEEAENVGRSPHFRRRILRMLADVGEALNHVHGAGVVHRDIKPANIMLRADLSPVLIDFGLSRDLFKDVSLTRSGAVMGTLSYMAPEQLGQAGSDVDYRTDIFALGLVLYRVLVGEDLRPDVRAVMQFDHLTLPLWKGGDSRLPIEVRAILYRCLDDDIQRRYESSAGLAADLRSAAEGGAISVSLPSALIRYFRRPQAKLGLLMGLCLVVLSALILSGSREGYYLWVDMLNDGGDLIIDGKTKHKTPLARILVEPGEHTLEYSYTADGRAVVPTVRRRFEVINHHTRVNVLTNPIREPSEIQRRFSEDPSAAMLLVRVGDPECEVFVDTHRVETSGRWLAMEPGRHTIRVRSGLGVEESQVVDLRPAQLNFINMLYSGTAEVEGAFRYSLGHVLSPRPDHVHLSLSDGAVLYMNDSRERSWAIKSPYSIALHNFITPIEPGMTASAILRVDFDTPMHSIVFMFSSSYHPDHASLVVDYRCGEQGAWQSLQIRPDSFQQIEQAQVPLSGARFFELRGRMIVNQVMSNWSTVQFLGNYLDLPNRADPCFSIVADPDRSKVVASPK